MCASLLSDHCHQPTSKNTSQHNPPSSSQYTPTQMNPITHHPVLATGQCLLMLHIFTVWCASTRPIYTIETILNLVKSNPGKHNIHVHVAKRKNKCVTPFLQPPIALSQLPMALFYPTQLPMTLSYPTQLPMALSPNGPFLPYTAPSGSFLPYTAPDGPFLQLPMVLSYSTQSQ